jgi:hypothetical protein
MSQILRDKHGNLFKSEGLAKNFIRFKKFKTHAEPVKVDGGWAVKLYDEGEPVGDGITDDTAAIQKTKDSTLKNDAPVAEEEAKQETVPEAERKVIGKIGDYNLYEDDDHETRILLGGEYVPAKNAYEIIDPYKDDRFVYKWANPKNLQGTRVEVLRAQGWQVDPVMKSKIQHLTAYRDYGQAVGNECIIRGKVLMRIPRHMAEQRNKRFRDMANANLEQEQKQLEEGTDGKLYGGINVSRA